MQTSGKEPFIEISKKGGAQFKEFNPYTISLKDNPGNTIEQILQAAKRYEDGSIGLSIAEAHKKNGVVVNKIAIHNLCLALWISYFLENRHLVDTILSYGGFSDYYAKYYSRFHLDALWIIRGLEVKHQFFTRIQETEAITDLPMFSMLDTSLNTLDIKGE